MLDIIKYTAMSLRTHIQSSADIKWLEELDNDHVDDLLQILLDLQK